MTMYRLMLYFLTIMVLGSLVLSGFNFTPYNFSDILFQTIFLLIVTVTLNLLADKIFNTVSNIESYFITAFILTLILGPYSLSQGWLILLVASTAAVFSKFIVKKNSSHIFNPAAFGVLITALSLNSLATWWAGGAWMAYVILVGGIFITQKIRRFHLIFSFLIAYFGFLILNSSLIQKTNILSALSTSQSLLSSSAFLFFMFVMLIEPLTSPRLVKHRIYFGIFTGLSLFGLQTFLSTLSYPLELSLIAGNIFGFFLSPNARQKITLLKKENITPTISNFWFKPEKPLAFSPGQYLEYTLPHKNSDQRGIRRYFTIASSPTEKEILLTSRFSEHSSSFKNKLKNMNIGDTMISSYLAGDFVLDSDPRTKYLFIAGGVGITPFRSIIKNLIDTKENRDITLVYAARNHEDLAFSDILKEAEQKLGIKIIYALADEGKKINEIFIKEKIPDFKDRKIYISGPEGMVYSMDKILKKLRLPRNRIKHDYFPGY
jgi:glycine betaine catabolism B